MNRPAGPERIRAQQALVSDPAVSAWVSANAGAGKTTVLVRRVIRLLLDGKPPARILCLTFTKAAAAHMANKVLETLREWVALDDGSLDQAISEVSSRSPTPERRALARRLFAQALETPGGLKVQTIHAFCDRILHQFPFEAGVPAGFEVLDEIREADLLQRARQSVLIDAANEPAGPLGRALAHAVSVGSDDALDKAVAECVRERRKVQRLIARGSDAAIAAALGIRADETEQAVEREILNCPELPAAEWPALATALSALNGNAKRTGERLAVASAVDTGAAKIDALFDVFFTGEGELRSDSQLGSGSVRVEHPALFARLDGARVRMAALRDKSFAARARARTGALLTLADATIRRFEASKRARGALDYSDLIERTADLLDAGAAAWVLFKLDGGIDHVLIDEAQDTSPAQWRVIAKLTEEFFAGRGAAEDRHRTIFAVGDDKQSIFSFQGADPAEFARMRRSFAQLSKAAQKPFEEQTLDLSFRSLPGVLAAIDQVFARPEAHRGLSSADDARPVHEAVRGGVPSLVEIWPPEKPEDREDDGLGWDAPVDAYSETSPIVRLAQRIAKAVRCWTGGGLAVGDGDKRRTPRAGDVIVLVRQRGPLFDAILQALKRAGVPVAGADRLKLTEHIAVMDLMALGEALVLARDELSLACALKSPLFGLSEDDLYELAQGRTGTLADALSGSRFGDAANLLSRWRAEALALRPFDFYSRVLGRDRGRERMLARLGHEAADAIDEFLTHALAYEATETPSLAGFLAFLRRAGTEVKRDLEVKSEAVRVMTVHGAKGLEAPIIVLADTMTLPDGRHDPKLLPLVADREAFVWALAKRSDSAALRAARAAAADARLAEYRRLLYVALTRAADALVVCGHESARQEGAPDGSWYQLVHDALKGAGAESEFVETAVPYGAPSVWRWRPQSMDAAAPPAAPPAGEAVRSDWLHLPAPPLPRAARRIAPSGFDAEEMVHERDRGSLPQADARRRGDLLHRLLQYLPERPSGERRAAAHRILDAAELSAAESEALIRQALRVLDHPALRELFGPGGCAELAFLSSLPGAPGLEISGRIDRIAVSADTLWIADYKSGTPPRDRDSVPATYIGQLALYGRELARIFPGRTVRTLLIWAAAEPEPMVVEIDATRRAAALATLTSP